jgi:uncharacterized membrane protein
MERERSVERLVAFTDAVVAIAITLLVLPLADVFSAGPGSLDTSSWQLLARIQDSFGLIFAFALGFVLIARLWWAHHRVFGPVQRWTLPLVILDLVWVFTIVLIPVTTSIIPHYEVWPLSFGIYCGVLLVSGSALTGLAALIHTSDAITTAHSRDTRNRLIGSAATAIGFLVALIVGLAFQPVNFFALLLVAGTGPFEWAVRRRLDRRRGGLPVSVEDARID